MSDWMRLCVPEVVTIEVDGLDVDAFGLFTWASFRSWSDDGLPDDPEKILRALRGRIGARQFAKAWPAARALMVVDARGRLRVPWVENCRAEQQAFLSADSARKKLARERAKAVAEEALSTGSPRTSERVPSVPADSADERTNERTDERTDQEPTLRAGNAADAARAPDPKQRKAARAAPAPDWAAHPSLDTPAMRAAWDTWSTHRRELKSKSWTSTGLAQCFAELEAMGPERAIAAIHHSVARNWAGIHEAQLAPRSRSGTAPALETSTKARLDGQDHRAARAVDVTGKVMS